MADRVIVDLLAAKVEEAIERTEHLISLTPGSLLGWHPALSNGEIQASDLGHLLGHLLDCTAGFCACFHAAFPVELADFASLRSFRVNQFCTSEETGSYLAIYGKHIERGFLRCTDSDLSRLLKTVFVPEGEALLTLLLGNLEHLLNHKYQLFFYLKLAGIRVGTEDLYRLRGSSEENV